MKSKKEKRISKNKGDVSYSTFIMFALLYIVMVGMLKSVFII